MSAAILAALLVLGGEAADGLPFRYFLVGPAGTLGQGRPGDPVLPSARLLPEFSVAIVEEREQEGTRYGLTRHGLWVPMRDLIPVRAPEFHGVEVPDGRLGFGWVIDQTRGTRRSLVQSVARERRAIGRALLRRPTLAQRPQGVGPGERWIDVDLSSQTLVAYEGDRPVFATLVSAGVGGAGSALATPVGTHHIYAKLLSAHMDNVEHQGVGRYYSVEDVPYVQYFAHGVALHGTFWHDEFGRARSHGCVNLAPRDAARLFLFTKPSLPAGQGEVAIAGDQGTVVRIR